MASVGSYSVLPFVTPVPKRETVLDANEVRGNDNTLRRAFVLHDADASIHVQSGTLAARPTTIADGATYFCTDTQDTYSRVAGAWVQSGWAHWYGTCFSTTTQTPTAANTAQQVTFNTSGQSRGVSLSANAMTVSYAGDYVVQFSLQLTNSGADDYDVAVWLTQNGTAVADSAGYGTIHKKHGAANGNLLLGFNQFLTCSANDVVRLYWQTTNTSVLLETLAAAGSVPRSPCAILTISRI